MRRWATSGHVRTVGRGHKRRVWASELAAMNGHNGRAGTATETATSDNRPPHTATAAEADRLADLVRELTVTVADLSATAAMWQARAQILEDRVRALEAPKEQPAPAAEVLRRRNTRRLLLALAALATLLVALLAAAAPGWAR